MDYSPPGSSVYGIFHERILKRLSFPTPGGLPYPGMQPMSPPLAGGFFTTEPSGKPVDSGGQMLIVLVRNRHIRCEYT